MYSMFEGIGVYESTFDGRVPVCTCDSCLSSVFCVWSQLMARQPVRMNDGGHPSQTVESSPVNVGYLKTNGHLEAISLQL